MNKSQILKQYKISKETKTKNQPRNLKEPQISKETQIANEPQNFTTTPNLQRNPN
jgi:hypothetical protein